MNDDPSVVSKADNTPPNTSQTDRQRPFHDVDTLSDARVPVESFVNTQVNGFVDHRNNGDSSLEKSDSEAETVVLSGKEENQERKMTKAIKLEEAGGAELGADVRQDKLPAIREDQREISRGNDARRLSLKRKRTMPDRGTSHAPDGGNSSNFSSTFSSPIPEAHSSKATGNTSDRSRSSPPLDEAARRQEGRVKKHRIGSNGISNDHPIGKSDGESGPGHARERRETRSATHFDGSVQRSESPPSRSLNRARSSQSTFPHSHGVTKRKKVPTPLQVERRRKTSEDNHLDSDDSSSVHSHHYLHKLTSNERNAMSPAKTAMSHKKNRDRNGRTFLARACAVDAAEAEKWLKERPQDLDVPDNAGNTPLQIAALEGDIEVVKLLLDAGCDTTCKNIDKDTPLIDAVENGHLEVVKVLLKSGLDPRQKNAKGQEPLELVPIDNDDADDIRAALLASKKDKELLRRPSEDQPKQNNLASREFEISSAGSGPSPTNSARSPPPPGLGARRRTARSQPTDDSLLWVNATPERLRDAAGKGDLTIVDHILKMRPKADTETVVAAARGGHDEVLGLLLAIANPDPDPEPLRSGEYKPAYSTPMLAAIGRGNIKVINLLLNQPGFDPTRRPFKGIAYHELSKDRQGSEWQEEYDILKEAYENHKQRGGRRSYNDSPRKVRTKHADSDVASSEPSSSPHDSRKVRKAKIMAKEESVDEVTRENSNKEAAFKRPGGDLKRQDSPAVASDRESEALQPPMSKAKEAKSGTDIALSTTSRPESSKPKRRLMSGNDFKTDQDIRRRTSLVNEASHGSDLLRRKSSESAAAQDQRQRRHSDSSESSATINKPRLEESTQPISESGKKRHRISVSPQASKPDLAITADVAKNKKRLRVDSQGNAIDQDRDLSFRPGPAMVANMIANPPAVHSPTLSQGTAPVAFMGSNAVSPLTKSPIEPQVHSALISPVNSIDQALRPRADQDDLQSQKQVGVAMLHHDERDQELEYQALQQEQERLAQVEAEKRQRAEAFEAEQARKAQAEKEEAEREALEKENARIEARRQVEEAERQSRLEQEEQEARVAKKKRDEESQKRRLEQDRIRKEEQERRRLDLEEREIQRRMAKQQEEERGRLRSLPPGLRRAAELLPEEARTTKEITKWLPLYTLETQELLPGCDPAIAKERWIANIQVAPVLAVKDLELSQCKWSPLFNKRLS